MMIPSEAGCLQVVFNQPVYSCINPKGGERVHQCAAADRRTMLGIVVVVLRTTYVSCALPSALYPWLLTNRRRSFPYRFKPRANIRRLSTHLQRPSPPNHKERAHSMSPSLFLLRSSYRISIISNKCLKAGTPFPTTSSPLSIPLTPPQQQQQRRPSSGYPQYDPPTGNLFGVPPGQKYQKEGWETIWVWGFWGSIGLAMVAYAFKPDTSYVLYISLSFWGIFFGGVG